MSKTEFQKDFESTIRHRQELAKKFADWEQIEKLRPRLRNAVLDYINGEVMGLSGGASRAGLDKIGFMQLLRRLKVPMVA